MKADEVKTVVIVGAGTMGAGIAGEFVRAGCDVRLVDKNTELLEQGMEHLRMAQDTLVKEKLLSKHNAQAALKRVSLVPDLADACAEADILLEAITEDLGIKQRFIAEADRLCPKRTLFASGTSGLSITKIASASSRPQRMVGMHFVNPPHVVPLVEIIKGERTSPATAKLFMDMARRMGKQPILVKKDVPGFVHNRLQFAVMREALHLLSEGIASAEEIDIAMSAGPGLRYAFMGPLRTADLGGLDIFHKISEYLFAELNSEATPSPALAKLVKDGKLGAKTGSGFYKYPPSELKGILERRDRVLLKFLAVMKHQNA